MIILKKEDINSFYLSVSENLPTSGTSSPCNLGLDYQFYFYDKNSKLTSDIVLSDISTNISRYNEFELDLILNPELFPQNGTYNYEVFLYDGVGATGSCLEYGMVKVYGDPTYPEEYVRPIDEDFIYIRKNS